MKNDEPKVISLTAREAGLAANAIYAWYSEFSFEDDWSEELELREKLSKAAELGVKDGGKNDR